MEVYKNLSGNSGITHYAIGEDYIIVMFKGSERYIYRASRIARYYIDEMISLAHKGSGLNTYINQNPEVKNNSEREY